ncbi:nucleolar complex protein 3 homolog isoform X1 [Cylas formicarius]|uniref:nucleolar complex protein 3 homolog isoform X1 n=1 Tax=Cylas formicarius TaxID=197179 RepID=UPI0029583D6E|nr:nucleolar complex protein 3 homolog isoform X1 [Cylas formicarius]
MGLKGKISKVKRNNQKRNKLVKQGIIKKDFTKHVKNTNKKLISSSVNSKNNQNMYEEESDDGDLLEMVESEDIDFLKEAITNQSYEILNKVKYTGLNMKPKKRKLEDDDDLENRYEDEIEETTGKRVKNLLPIKTKHGLVLQQIIEDISGEEDNEDRKTATSPDQAQMSNEKNGDLGEYFLNENKLDLSKPVLPAQLLAARIETLRQKKIYIGSLSSGLLENPEEKIANFTRLLKIMAEDTTEAYFTIKKLVIVSLTEVFKDILPAYEIKNLNPQGVKLKKETLKLQKYEESLLAYYRKFLQKIEKYCFFLVKKKGDTRKLSEEDIKLAETSIHSMCELLVSHPYFNYAQNIAKLLVPFLNNSRKNVREMVKVAIKTIFKEDKKEAITLKILRLTNNYLKNHTHVNADMLEILLELNLKDVNLDQEKEQDIREKKMKAKKMKILQMSKKERKRKKKLQELEKEMLETKAEENRQERQQNLTEITKVLFNIYFRILKNSENSKSLSTCLEGLAKFAHIINLEYYIDMVKVLGNLLNEEWMGNREKLHCIQTIFKILSGQGEAVNIDPLSFYAILYKELLVINAGRNHENCEVILNTLVNALIKRRKKITSKRTISFVKRLMTLSLQLLHNGSLSCLCLVKTLMQLNKSLDILLDLDSTVGEGKFHACSEDPEYANASNTALFETTLLCKHYHPIVRKFSKNIASGVPTTGDGSLPVEFGKMTTDQLYTNFSMSEMAFNPSVPVLKNVQCRTKINRKHFVDTAFQDDCKFILKTNEHKDPFWISI